MKKDLLLRATFFAFGLFLSPMLEAALPNPTVGGPRIKVMDNVRMTWIMEVDWKSQSTSESGTVKYDGVPIWVDGKTFPPYQLKNDIYYVGRATFYVRGGPLDGKKIEVNLRPDSNHSYSSPDIPGVSIWVGWEYIYRFNLEGKEYPGMFGWLVNIAPSR